MIKSYISVFAVAIINATNHYYVVRLGSVARQKEFSFKSFHLSVMGRNPVKEPEETW